MKFMAKTTMNAATYRDLSLALQQGSLIDIEMSTMSEHGVSTWAAMVVTSRMKNFLTILYFVGSLLVLCFGLNSLRLARRNYQRATFALKEPLVMA
jgi:hypothetical protein